jgi:hypothetical protein
MEKKQTAVEWLEEQYYESEGKLTRHDFEQAKQMEKEQMIKFSYKVLNESNDSITGYVDEEKIYNETYGGQDE